MRGTIAGERMKPGRRSTVGMSPGNAFKGPRLKSLGSAEVTFDTYLTMRLGANSHFSSSEPRSLQSDLAQIPEGSATSHTASWSQQQHSPPTSPSYTAVPVIHQGHQTANPVQPAVGQVPYHQAVASYTPSNTPGYAVCYAPSHAPSYATTGYAPSYLTTNYAPSYTPVQPDHAVPAYPASGSVAQPAGPTVTPQESTYTPAQPSNRNRHMVHNPNAIDVETLDSRYKRVSSRDRSNFFQRGRVFATLWTEPSSHTSAERTAHSSFSQVRFGGTVFTEIRRFVIVQNRNQFSKCIPIQTYGGQGTKKAGVIVQDHAIIYCGDTDADAPRPLPGERLTKNPIRVKPYRGEKLDPESRVNFGKVYTVEHNLKVRHLGKVDEGHLFLLDSYWRSANEGD